MIELTEDQAAAMERERAPLRVVNPHTGEVFVLIRQDIYTLTCSIIGGGVGRAWSNDADDLIRKPA